MMAQRLCKLDTGSSIQFLEQLKLLPEGELVELIGYLNSVRAISTTMSHSSFPQIFDDLDSINDAILCQLMPLV